jgi:hypothetical protein
MPFGASVLFGDDNAPIPSDMSQWLVEIRVEQELNKITRFAVRFEDDLCGQAPAVEGREELTPNTLFSIVVPDGDESACLVRGRITRIKSSSQLGGAGSWIEAHGESRQIEMDRETMQANWAGPEAQIVESVLGYYTFAPDVANIQSKTYTTTEQLNQRGTDFAFLNKIASENGVDFWVSYELLPANPLTGARQIVETAHFRISPEVPDNALFAIADFLLTPVDSGPSFRVNVNGDNCPNVNSFNVEIDAERPNQANGQAVDVGSGETGDASSTPDPATQGDGPTIDALDGVTRTIAPTGPGNGQDQQRRQDAALRAASWFVSAEVSTSAHMLGSVLVPHQIIQVEGAGERYSIPYQVKAVTHVINASDHLMDVKLRSNFIGGQS